MKTPLINTVESVVLFFLGRNEDHINFWARSAWRIHLCGPRRREADADAEVGQNVICITSANGEHSIAGLYKSKSEKVTAEARANLRKSLTQFAPDLGTQDWRMKCANIGSHSTGSPAVRRSSSAHLYACDSYGQCPHLGQDLHRVRDEAGDHRYPPANSWPERLVLIRPTSTA